MEKSAIAFVGDYLPRRCGIATFTHDLCEQVAVQAGADRDVFAVAVNDTPEGYPYPDRVRFEIREAAQADYRLAADYLNIHQVSTVCLQHEFGIFGGAYGSHVLTLLRGLRRPLVTTLHTLPKDASGLQRSVLQEITRLSDRVVVLSEMGREILCKTYRLPSEKVAMIPHGIPDMPFVDPNFFKDQFGVEGKKVLMTFGLLSPNKGIEYVIDALPIVLEKYPDIAYIVLGTTHPKVKREFGEEYRNSLVRRAHELGVSQYVIFQNRFVELSELVEYLGAADIYITPYLNEGQIVSGTLAYALGAGKPVVSTPYWYAREMLADGHGRLVPFRDSRAIGEQVIDLLTNETERHAMRKRAYTMCRKMIWKRVAQDYLDLFAQASEPWVEKQRCVGSAVGSGSEQKDSGKAEELPEADLRHLRMLTDDTGILQHCLYVTPDRRHGYSTDDNARALIVTTMRWEQSHDEDVLPLMQKYLAFLAHAMDESTQRFRNFMNYDRTWCEPMGSEDSHARTLWGLGMAVALCPHDSMIALATRLFRQGLPALESFSSPRAWAFAVVGIHAYLRRFSGDSEVRRYRVILSERLLKHFSDHMTDDWPWCEDMVTYSNAKLPQALLMSGRWLQRPEMIEVGKRALEWLLKIQTNAYGMISLIGTNGWYVRGQPRAQFDQQPIDAHALTEACIEAYHLTGERHWADEARKAFNWFLGDNDLRTPLYDFTTGGCRDGLHADRVNENQGAESTLAWLMSLLSMHGLQAELILGEAAPEERPVPEAIRGSRPVPGMKVTRRAHTSSDDK